jgi:hypothetical protein
MHRAIDVVRGYLVCLPGAALRGQASLSCPPASQIRHLGDTWRVSSAHDHGCGPQSFSGIIFAPDGSFTEVRRIRTDPGDWVRRSRDGRRIYFSFVTRRGVDGLDFRTDAARILFRLRINGREAAPRAEIFLGRSGRHPFNNPFVLFVKEADRDDDGARLEFQEPAKDDFDVLDLVPGGELEEESQGTD